MTVEMSQNDPGQSRPKQDDSESPQLVRSLDGVYIGKPSSRWVHQQPADPTVAALNSRIRRAVGDVLDITIELLKQVAATDDRGDQQAALKEFSEIAGPIMKVFFGTPDSRYEAFMDNARINIADSFDAPDFVILDTLRALRKLKQVTDRLTQWLIIKGGTAAEKRISARELATAAGISNRTASTWIDRAKASTNANKNATLIQKEES